MDSIEDGSDSKDKDEVGNMLIEVKILQLGYVMVLLDGDWNINSSLTLRNDSPPSVNGLNKAIKLLLDANNDVKFLAGKQGAIGVPRDIHRTSLHSASSDTDDAITLDTFRRQRTLWQRIETYWWYISVSGLARCRTTRQPGDHPGNALACYSGDIIL